MSHLGDVSASQRVLSSCTGAFITALFLTPFDVVKTRLQAQQRSIYGPKSVFASASGQRLLFCPSLINQLCICGAGVADASTIAATTRLHFAGTMDAFLRIPQYEGVPSLWKGLPPTLLIAVPGTVIYYTSYDQLKLAMGYKENYLGKDNVNWAPAVAGSLARIIAGSIVSPIELMRTKLQAQKDLNYAELTSVIKRSIRSDGIRPLYRGLPASLLRDVPFSVVLWMSYENLKTMLNNAVNIKSTFVLPFVAATISGGAAGLVTQPFDVIKTHHQMRVGELEEAGAERFPTMMSTARKIWQHYGWRGLLAGMSARVVKVGIACALMISSYEFFKSYFRTQNRLRIEN
ncbi:probable mitochondrial glutathione transporter SLC25A39 [Corticium candelabrum]|uniref:probable mitochondrial glutathione transporter SLC25A39 n=1 Tax=Corticium candelabrum TaxID=121492 RepID=UPI002E25228D|nr:probable mitochondrial glutathione transporter SLC25A39 [Corticium candelabrum]